MAGPRDVDASFLSLPLSALTEAALTRAVDLGCEHADLRVERIRTQSITLRDARLAARAAGGAPGRGGRADRGAGRIRTQSSALRDARLEARADGEDLGLAVRVVHEGTWGFAAGVVLTAAEAVRLAEEAVEVAKVSAAVNSD